MKQVLTVLLCLIASTPAVAEVCDKARPIWKPQDGPIGQFEDLALFLFEPVGLIAAGLTLVALLLKNAWFSVAVIAVLMLLVAVNVGMWRGADDITSAAIAEGCITTPILTTIALIAMATGIATLTWLAQRNWSESA